MSVSHDDNGQDVSLDGGSDGDDRNDWTKQNIWN